MKKNQAILIALVGAFLLTPIGVLAESYFIVGNDTTFCDKLSYKTTGQGYLKSITYTTTSGEEVHVEGKKNVPDVITFCINGSFFDKTPLKANKPNGYIRYTKRSVDGKLIVYLQQQGYDNSYHYTPNTYGDDWQKGGPVGTYRFYLKMPDGTFYKINKKGNIKKFIKPYLLECDKFKEAYNGDFSTEEKPFMEMIKLYNSLCG